jgi:uncharacterized membrane protein
MPAWLRKVWLDLNSSYWFIPSLLTLLAAALAVATIWLDHRGAGTWLVGTGWVDTSSAEGARSQLSVIASAMIAIASTVFAITIAAVAFASGNFGPRLLTNFMNDRGNQVSLGVFIATFAYSLLVLRTVRSPEEAEASAAAAVAEGFVPQLSLLVSTALVAIAVAVLVYFLHHVPASIRINTVLAGIGRRLLDDIAERFPEDTEGRQPAEGVPGLPLSAVDTGYIEIIDFQALDRAAAEHDVVVSLSVRTGDFVHPHVCLLEVSGGALTDELKPKLHAALALGASRTRAQDIEFLIDELVEIALRALSPGVNDPFTAITSLHWMGAALASLAGRNLARGPEQEEYDPKRVRPRADDFRHFVARSFGGVRQSAAESPIAAKIFLDALGAAAVGCIDPCRRRALLEEGGRLVEQARHALDGPARREIEERFQRLEQDFAEGRVGQGSGGSTA